MRKPSRFLVLVCLLFGIAIIDSCKKDPELPVLTTSAITNIALTSGTSGGNITSSGGADVTARGVCWSTSSTPTITGSHTTDGKGSGTFTSNIDNLTPSTKYYVRAYATNSVGTAYGNEVSFTTAAIVAPTLTTTAISATTLTTASSGGSISADGGAAVTARGVCWATTANPTVSNDKTTDGAGNGLFTSNLTGLTPGTTYFVRAYATNTAGTSYGNEISFTTSPVVVPTLTTTIASSITLTTAVSGGNISADGGAAVTARGVCWATTTNPTVSNNKTTDASGIGVFTSNLTGLAPATTYYVRAYATNTAGIAYGNEVSFTTSPVVVPTLTTAIATSITLTSAVSGGTISADGGGAVTARGICWATTANPTTSNSTAPGGTGTGVFASNLTGLSAGTTYHIRAYATNSAGTAYGNDVQFTTSSAVVATLTTTTVTSIDLTTAVSGGNITSNGGDAVTASGLCWSETTNPTVSGAHTTDGSASGSFSSTMTGLTKGVLYYVRAYATNGAGTAYGNQVSFTTKIDDADGNSYNTVLIGTQIWMAENLKTTMFNNSSVIPLVTAATGPGSWSVITTPGYCWYDNDDANKSVYGAMYNWYAVNTGDLCPAGWSVPTNSDFNTLEVYLGLPSADVDVWGYRGTDHGAKMKNTTGWLAGGNGTNTSGFSALPGGYRYYVDGSYVAAGSWSYWWSSTEVDAGTAYYRRLNGDSDAVYMGGVNKGAGKYVRCLKD